MKSCSVICPKIYVFMENVCFQNPKANEADNIVDQQRI